jgi:hypothetical protein
MFELNKNLELNLLNYFKEFAENYLNEIMYYEREEFLKKEKDNRASGYNKRNLKLSFELSLELKVPKVRKNAKHLNFSVFEKYKRNSFIFDKKLFDLYSSRMFEKEICKLLDISSINYKKKKEIKKKYLEKYNKFMLKYIESFDILKLDATEFGKKKNKYIHTVYFIWGLKKENGKTIKKMFVIYCWFWKRNKKRLGNYFK